MHVYVVFTHYSFENSDVFRVTDLHNEFTTPSLDVSLKNRIAILCYPDYVYGHSGDGVTVIAEVVGHSCIVSETESLALKCIV
jgi:hypothetical protein